MIVGGVKFWASGYCCPGPPGGLEAVGRRKVRARELTGRGSCASTINRSINHDIALIFSKNPGYILHSMIYPMLQKP